MLRVRFLNVGQGDSIIIEWTTDEERCIGLIDCNATNRSNPVVDYLRLAGYKRIAFIILSHPHTDHYSGLGKILDHCESKGITVGRFYHTAQFTKGYLAACVNRDKDRRRLKSLFNKVNALVDKNVIVKRGYITDDTKERELGLGINMAFLAPSVREFEAFNKVAFKNTDLSKRNNADANLLSTVIKIYGDNWYLLLTADAEAQTLQRVETEYLQREKRLLVLGQVPHHGSEHNHESGFWQRRTRASSTPLVISVGDNDYGHPADSVILDLLELEYKVWMTGGAELVDEADPILILYWDLLSEETGVPSEEAQDRIFEIADGKVEMT